MAATAVPVPMTLPGGPRAQDIIIQTPAPHMGKMTLWHLAQELAKSVTWSELSHEPHQVHQHMIDTTSLWYQ